MINIVAPLHPSDAYAALITTTDNIECIGVSENAGAKVHFFFAFHILYVIFFSTQTYYLIFFFFLLVN